MLTIDAYAHNVKLSNTKDAALWGWRDLNPHDY